MKTAAPFLLVLLCFLAIEALLLVRVWAQATSQPMETDAMAQVFSLSDQLASPFEGLTGDPPLQTTGVIDFTILVAIEGYFIAMLAVVFVLFWLAGLRVFLRGRRTEELPPFAQAIEAPRNRRQAWQPVTGSRLPSRRYYVAVSLHDDSPAHAKAGLGRI